MSSAINKVRKTLLPMHFHGGDDLRTNPFQEEGNDGSRTKEGSMDPLEVPLGPMTRARAKRFKEAVHVLIRDAHVEEARVFNSKKETKMVHIIKLNPDLDQAGRPGCHQVGSCKTLPRYFMF